MCLPALSILIFLCYLIPMFGAIVGLLGSIVLCSFGMVMLADGLGFGPPG